MDGLITAYTGAALFDGSKIQHECALIVQGGVITGTTAPSDIPDRARIVRLDGGTLAPGFVDLQVNGGGGIMLNETPTLAGVRQIGEAHLRLGATAILPTLITDTPELTKQAILAVKQAIAQAVPTISGLHLEGPHLARARKGAHEGTLIRSMDQEDLDLLCRAAQELPVLMITLAPESVTLDQIRALSDAGAILSLGHTDASFEHCRAAAQAGVRCVTHLFNAMRQLNSREPGVVGAGLALGTLSAGMICDLIHVHPESIRLALAAKQGPGQVFLVSDAMAVAGTDMTSFGLNGRDILRRDRRLTLEDGTLAGADLDLATAIRNLCGIGVPLVEALAMATSIPASVIGCGETLGHLRVGAKADFVHLDHDLNLRQIWLNGQETEPFVS